MKSKIIYVGEKNRLITFDHEPNMSVRVFIEKNALWKRTALGQTMNSLLSEIRLNDPGFIDVPAPTWQNHETMFQKIIHEHGYHGYLWPPPSLYTLRVSGTVSERRWLTAKRWTIENIPHKHRKWDYGMFWFTFESDLMAFLLACK